MGRSSNLLAGIPERYTRFVQLPNEKGHNAVWDFQRSPDDRFYVSVCGENEKPLNALLYEYYPKTGNLRLIIDVEKIWIIDPEQMPPSKIHTSIDFLPDGKLIMATHNTAPAPGHKQWMFEQNYEHPWEGYPGSILMIVDPDTNEVHTRGIPVPRESIYGGMLGNDPRYYYFLGYMFGHFYRLDLETNEVKDYGKVSEYSSCRLVKDKKGCFYGSSFTGGLWRLDPATDAIENLHVNFRSPNGTKHRRQFIFALHSPRDTIFMVDNMDPELLELDPETLEVTRHGHVYLPEQIPVNGYGIGGFAADENFVLYYGLKTWDEYSPIRLVRWDILGGGKPENLGLISPGGKDSQYICEMAFDRDGWLQMVDVCGEFSPYILAVDVKQLQPPMADAPNAILREYYEPDYNGVGRPAFVHIEADVTLTLPLHQHMDWDDTAVNHVRAINGRVYCISGKTSVHWVETGYADHAPQRIDVVYDVGAPISSMDVNDREVAVLTSDQKVAVIGLEAGRCNSILAVPSDVVLVAFHCVVGRGKLLASDDARLLYVCDLSGESVRLQKSEDVRLAADESAVILLDEQRILLSGVNDELIVYNFAEMNGTMLDVKASSIRGRAYQAAISGGAVLADGTVVVGTCDGMLFTLSSNLKRRISYGRLYSSGQLRNFIRVGDDAVLGIYGGARDAGHVFHFSPSDGFVDLGRPRLIKDNADQRHLGSEFANIHYISCLAYAQDDDYLCVASGELYGCVVRYHGVNYMKERNHG